MKFLENARRRIARPSDEQFYFILLAVLTTVVATIVMNFALGLHRNFLTIACDTAAYHNAIANTLNGSWFRDTAYAGPNLLGCAQHVQLVLLPLAIIYALIPTVDTLFVLQIWGVYGAVIPLYFIGLEILRRPVMAFLIALAALASPLLFHLAVSPFHPESWILIGMLGAYYFYRRDRHVGFWASLVFAMASCEQAAFIAILWGLSLLVWDDGLAWRKRYGKMALAAGIGWLIFTMGLVAPMMHVPEQDNLISYHYPNWHIDSVSGLVFAVLREPFQALAMLLSPARWSNVFAFVGLPLLWAFASRRTLILLAPCPIYFLMCDQEFFLYFHAYYFQFLFLAGYLGFLLFLVKRELSDRLVVVAVTAVFFLNVLLLCGAIVFYEQLAAGEDPVLSRKIHEEFSKLPVEAGVYSPHRYSAYLSSHLDMVMGDLHDENVDFDKMIEDRYAVTHVHAADIKYIVCDLFNDQCGWRQGGFNQDVAKRRADNIERLVKSGQWQVEWNQDNLIILRRAGK